MGGFSGTSRFFFSPLLSLLFSSKQLLRQKPQKVAEHHSLAKKKRNHPHPFWSQFSFSITKKLKYHTTQENTRKPRTDLTLYWTQICLLASNKAKHYRRSRLFSFCAFNRRCHTTHTDVLCWCSTYPRLAKRSFFWFSFFSRWMLLHFFCDNFSLFAIFRQYFKETERITTKLKILKATE